MPKKAPKIYKVKVSYCQHTPEEAARLEEQIIDAIYRSKMIAMKIPDKEAVNT